jgi:hypothetical protein
MDLLGDRSPIERGELGGEELVCALRECQVGVGQRRLEVLPRVLDDVARRTELDRRAKDPPIATAKNASMDSNGGRIGDTMSIAKPYRSPSSWR